MLDAEGVVLYVGKAKILKRRVSSYFRASLPSARIALMVSRIAAIEITVTRSEAEALLLENNLIKRLSPRYNIVFRDDKSYPYIRMSREDFPRIAFFRGAPDRKADYFGPFPSALAVRESLHLLQKMFRLRTCEDSVFAHRSRPCLLHQIGRCSAPCVPGLTRLEDYQRDAQHAAWFLSGRHSEIQERLQKAMQSASERMAFEDAAHYRDQLQSLRRVQEQQHIDSGRAEDIDIIVAVREEDLLCLNLAMVRGGRHLGDRPQFPAHGDSATPEEAIKAFLAQHYARHPPPARLLLFPSLAPEEYAECVLGLSAAEFPVIVPQARGKAHRAWMDMALENARLAIAARRRGGARQWESLIALREVLALQALPRRIECFDVSHTGGELPVASCVVFQADTRENGSGSDGGMRRRDYRRFNIRDIDPGDDYAAIRQAVRRRYAKIAEECGVMPDIILIDGGKGQVRAAAEALAELGLSHHVIFGIGKGEGRKVGLESLVFADERENLLLGIEHPALRLLVEIRDEAHRFALLGHRARRVKARRASRLEEIPGIGAARRKALLARFGGLTEVQTANREQLAQTPGISRALAENIYAALHEENE